MDEKVFGGVYRVEREMGVETIGRTFLASDPDGRKVVVKVVRPADKITADIVESDIAALSGVRHPALPHVYKWGHDGEDFYMVREYVGGVDLKRVIGEQGRLAGVVAARYGAEAADALEQIHRRGLVHGNVKTANLIRLPEDPAAPSAVKLVGYGLGLRGDAAAVTSTAPASIAHYLAPEQVAGEPVTPQTDIYALGVVLYELVTGRVPFDGPTAAAVADLQAHAVPTPVRELAPDVSPALEAVIMRALEKAPQARFSSAAEMKAALEAATPTSAAVVAAPPKKKMSPWVWVAVVAAVLLLCAGAAWAYSVLQAGKSTVPSVVGTSVNEATTTIAAAGLSVGAISYTGSSAPGVADGTVTSQTPPAGTQVAKGSSVDIVISGAEKVSVPNVIGLDQGEATLVLQRAGLVVGNVTEASTTAAKTGTVSDQNPAGGALLSKGGAVALVIAVAPPVAGTVPDVGGLTEEQASDAITAAGFKPKTVKASSADVQAGQVIDQNPAAGVQAAPGSTVTITISTGPAPVEVPSVTGKTQTDATNILTNAGFKVKVTEATGGGPVGTVTDQSPGGGTQATPGSTVTITVAK